MTIKTGLLILGLLPGALWLMPAAHAKATVEQPVERQTVTLNLRNMTCALCAVTVKKALQKVEGVQQVTVDYDSKMAAVTFDSKKTDSAALIKATTDAGYPATVAATHSR